MKLRRDMADPNWMVLRMEWVLLTPAMRAKPRRDVEDWCLEICDSVGLFLGSGGVFDGFVEWRKKEWGIGGVGVLMVFGGWGDR